MSIVDIATGMNALAAILMAAFERQRSGLGQKLDVCLYDCALSYLHPHATAYLQTGLIPSRSGNRHPSVAPYEEFATKTGPMFLGVGNDGQFRAVCNLLERPELAADPNFATNPQRVKHRDELHEALQSILIDKDAERLSERLLNCGVPASVIRDVPQAMAASHTAHREMIVEEGGYRALGIPIKLSRTPGKVRSTPKKLGSDTRAVCRGVGFEETEIDEMVANGIVFETSNSKMTAS
jgi:crotonobetainyl-CoA:carnitine CoA-transferase CaiB-like acyl-CoA transferase